MKNRKNGALSINDEILNKLYYAKTLVNMTKTSCLEREFTKEYYGMSIDKVSMLSDERNEYLAMLDLISDKISDIFNMNI